MRGNRKTVVIGGAMLLAAVLAVVGKLTAEATQVLVAGIVAYGGGNAVEHYCKRS